MLGSEPSWPNLGTPFLNAATLVFAIGAGSNVTAFGAMERDTPATFFSEVLYYSIYIHGELRINALIYWIGTDLR